MSDFTASYVSGVSDVPLLGHTIGHALDRATAAWGDRTALISRAQGVLWTWRELRDRADAFAAGLLALGLRRGDRIGIWSLNRAEWALTQFAAGRAGLVLVTINPAYRLSELEFVLNKVGCAALVTATGFKNSDYIGMVKTLAPELATSVPGKLSAARLPHLRIVIQIGGPPVAGAIAFDEVAARGVEAELSILRELAHDLQFDDPINIQFTSGTTGSPKGVTLTHHNILNNGYFVGRAMRLTEVDRICIPVPLYHCFGMVMGNLAAVTHGCAMVYPGEGFDPLATLETVQAEKCTALYGVPTMFIAELDHPDFARFDLGTLRTGIMAGAACSIEVIRKVLDRMNMPGVTIAYRMTENSSVSFQSAVNNPREIEEFLFSHPKIQDVQVFGVADQKYGEELCAWIRLREGETMSEDDVRDFCRGQIAHQKIPRYVEFVDEFPMTVTGKVQKFIMRQRVEERRGLKSAKTA